MLCSRVIASIPIGNTGEEHTMRITIEGSPIDVVPGDRNIVDVAHRAGVGIPAPCFRSGAGSGCCRVCVVEVDGSLEYACCTVPAHGMSVTVRRPDLVELRRQRIAEYLENGRQGSPCDCGCSGGSSCCG